MTKQANIIHNGKSRHISDLQYDGIKASGRISGRLISKDIGEGRTMAEVKHILIAAHDETYGDKPLTKKEVMQMARKATMNCKVKNTHVENLGNGLSVATGEVDGKEVMIMYDGKVTSRDGKEMNGKPWLGDVRKDLLAKYEKTGGIDMANVKQDPVMRRVNEEIPQFVNDAFIARLKSIGFEVWYFGTLPYIVVNNTEIRLGKYDAGKIEWYRQTAVCRQIETAYEKAKKTAEENQQKVEKFFMKWSA